MTDFIDADTSRPLRLRCGEDLDLEKQAAEWLAQGREGVTALSDKRDYLTRDQLLLRWKKEILTEHLGDSFSSGLFKKAYNPLANSRPSKPRRREE